MLPCSPVGRELTAAGNVGLLVLNFAYIMVSACGHSPALLCLYGRAPMCMRAPSADMKVRWNEILDVRESAGTFGKLVQSTSMCRYSISICHLVLTRQSTNHMPD